MVEKRFELKEELRITKAVNKIFSEEQNLYSEEEILNLPDVTVMDPASVAMIISKSDRFDLILRRFINKDNTITKVPSLKYDSTDSSSKYSVEYLKRILDLFYTHTESLEISISQDYPITIECTDYKILLANRYQNE